MKLNVEDFNDSVSRVEWFFRIDSNDDVEFYEEQFCLNPVLHPGIPPLKVLCNFSIIESEENHSFEDQCEISLQLVQAKPKLNPKKKLKQNCDVADIQVDNSYFGISHQNRPSKVWASINGIEKFQMQMIESRGSSIIGKWYSDTFIVTNEPGRDPFNNFKLTCIFYIEFETFGEGAKSLVKNVSDMFTLQTSCDVQFCFGENQLVGGHKNILAARSRVFAAMFQHNMVESSTGKVKIQDFELDVFKELLYFIYSGRFSKILNEDLALSLLSAADKYEIEDMKKSCINYLQQTLGTSNAIKYLISAHLQSFEILKEAAIAFIVKNGKEISQLQDWEYLATNYPMLSVQVTRRMIK